MGKIGRFIDAAVAHDADLMTRVHDRPWGTLMQFVSHDADDKLCGCMVGSIALEANHSMQACRTTIVERIASEALGVSRAQAYQIGIAVWTQLVGRLAGGRRTKPQTGLWWSMTYYSMAMLPDMQVDEAEQRVIFMLKGRIARRLRERQQQQKAEAGVRSLENVHA